MAATTVKPSFPRVACEFRLEGNVSSCGADDAQSAVLLRCIPTQLSKYRILLLALPVTFRRRFGWTHGSAEWDARPARRIARVGDGDGAADYTSQRCSGFY